MLLKVKTSLQAFLNKLDANTLEVFKKSSASMVVKIAGQIAAFLISISLARFIGADGLGIINLSNKIVALLLILTTFGFNNVIIKNIAISDIVKNNKRIASIINTSFFFNGALSLLLALIAFLTVPYLCNSFFNKPDLEVPLTIAVLMIIPQTISRVYASSLNGLKKIWQSNLVNEALSSWVVGILLLSLYFLDFEITIINVAYIYALGRIVVLLSVILYWKKTFKYKGTKNFLFKPMLKMALPLLLVSGSTVIAANVDVLMIGSFCDSTEVGRYSVAARLALLMSFFLQVSNSAISPNLARLFTEKKIDDMKMLVNRVTGALVIISLLFLLVFLFTGKFILQLWGDEFIDAYNILIILSIGQFFNMATGCSGLLLVMCGFEKIHGNISVFCLILNLILNYLLINSYGAIGAAIATAIVFTLSNLLKMIYVKVKIGILTIPSL